MPRQLISMNNVGKCRGESYDLKIKNFSLAFGEHVAITGPSGCGKSTTLDIIGLALNPDQAGEFMFSPEGREYDIAAMSREGKIPFLTELRRCHLGYVLQTGEIFGFLNVKQNIELTALAKGANKAEAEERARLLMARLQIERLAKAMPATLSIGERQRVAIARALATKPCLILADEPTSALDPGLARNVMRLMLEAIADDGASLIMVTHDLALVSEFAFREAPIRTEQTERGIEAYLDE